MVYQMQLILLQRHWSNHWSNFSLRNRIYFYSLCSNWVCEKPTYERIFYWDQCWHEFSRKSLDLVGSNSHSISIPCLGTMYICYCYGNVKSCIFKFIKILSKKMLVLVLVVLQLAHLSIILNISRLVVVVSKQQEQQEVKQEVKYSIFSH